jgi:hypothetical protein
MSKMRLWLDGQRSEPASFTYEQNGEEVIVGRVPLDGVGAVGK